MLNFRDFVRGWFAANRWHSEQRPRIPPFGAIRISPNATIDRRANYVHSREVVDVELAEVGSSSEQGIAAQQQANSVLHPEQCEVVKMRRKLLQNLDACLGERQRIVLDCMGIFRQQDVG